MARDFVSNLVVGLAVFVSVAFTQVVGAEAAKFTYYVQLIRGDNEAKAPEHGARHIGSKLADRLQPLQYESYWEIKRQKVNLALGQKTRVRLNKESEVEIDLTDAAHRTVTAYQAGKPVDRTTRPVGEAMTIIGGSRGTNSLWFIVVRRDPPKN